MLAEVLAARSTGSDEPPIVKVADKFTEGLRAQVIASNENKEKQKNFDLKREKKENELETLFTYANDMRTRLDL